MSYEVLFIPANMWVPVEPTVVHNIADIRSFLGCRMAEFIYPLCDDRGIPGLEHHVLIGDEEGRMVDRPQVNHRATHLSGYPYSLVGDFILAGNKVTEHDQELTDYAIGLLYHLRAPLRT